jgi:anti-sigma regulatory factor (Ser/Thr protein kinase)
LLRSTTAIPGDGIEGGAGGCGPVRRGSAAAVTDGGAGGDAPEDDRSIEIGVPVELAGLGPVRERVVAAAASWGFPDLQELEVVASELITNAVVHSGTDAVLTCRPTGAGGVELSVCDHGAGDPRMGEISLIATSGRGLQIVDALTDSWGIDRASGTMTVWARMTPRHP